MIDIIDSDCKEIADQLSAENQQFDGKRILLAGGSGFLGSMFKRYCLYLNKNILKNPIKIISVDNFIKGTVRPTDEIQDENITYIHHDLTIPLGPKLDYREKIDYIFNFSGNASPATYTRHFWPTIWVSTLGTANLLELARVYDCKIMNFSSSEVLGTPADKDIPTNEDVTPSVHTMNDRANYDTSKMLIEVMSWGAKTKQGVDAKVVRPFNCLGLFSREDYRVIPNFISSLLQDKPIRVFLPGTQTRTFCYYTDFFVGIIKVMLNGRQLLYHIGNQDNEINMKDLAFMMERIAGKSGLVQLVETPDNYKHEPKRRCPDISRARNELGYNPKVNLEDALTRIYGWAKENYKF